MVAIPGSKGGCKGCAVAVVVAVGVGVWVESVGWGAVVVLGSATGRPSSAGALDRGICKSG